MRCEVCEKNSKKTMVTEVKRKKLIVCNLCEDKLNVKVKAA